MKQNSIAIIVPYFGKFNHYFPLWLLSCQYNPTINWIMLTDDHTAYDYPDNVKVIFTTFPETVKRIQSYFDFPISLSNPYQLCEFKVCYGEVFQEYLKDFDFWGFCDVDLIWGDLRAHLPEEVLNEYDKISWRGHFSLIRNTATNNKIYRSPYEGAEIYKCSLGNKTVFQCSFEEGLINDLFELNNLKVYTALIFADLKIRPYNFSLLHFDDSEAYKNEHQIFSWNKGKLTRHYVQNDEMKCESFAYIHFLKRPMELKKIEGDAFFIVPNKFIPYTKELSVATIQLLSKSKIYWKYYWKRMNLKHLKMRIDYKKGRAQFEQVHKEFPLLGDRIKLPASKTSKCP